MLLRRGPASQRWRWLLRTAAALILLQAAVPATAGTLSKVELEAGYVVNMVKYTEWPAAGAAGPFVIAVAGKPRVAEHLRARLNGRQIAGRSVELITPEGPEQLPRVDVLVLGAGEDWRLDDWLGSAGGPVLTIGESPAFARRGGIVTLVIDYDRIRFDLNMATADRAGLAINAQVQKLAKSVTRSP